MKQTKYLVRPDDFQVFEVDPSNNCYRTYEGDKQNDRPEAFSHFTFNNLTTRFGFIPIEEKDLEEYLIKNANATKSV